MNNQYALAFFQIAKEDNVLESCKESFEALIELLKNDLEFSSFLNSPKIKTAEKQNFLKKVFSPAFYPPLTTKYKSAHCCPH
jgi:F0F1-type ATP synthase delta subunit